MTVLVLLLLLSILYVADTTIRILDGVNKRDVFIIALNGILLIFIIVNVYTGLNVTFG